MDETPEVPEVPTETNLRQFPSAEERANRPRETPQPPKDSPKPAKRVEIGDWVRYYTEDGRLSIAKVEYITVKDKTVVFFTDRGLVPDGTIVEFRKASNV